MHAVLALLTFAASAMAITVVEPDNSTIWTTTGQHIVQWNSVSTDPANFSIVLSNEAIFPNVQQLLNAQVDTSLGSLSVNAPSGGWPTGKGFQINLVQSSENLNAILAQSNDFTITTGSGSTSSSSTGTTSSGSSTLTVASTPSTSTPATSSGSTESQINPPASQSSTSTNPSGNGALSTGVQAGFFGVVALVGAMLV